LPSASFFIIGQLSPLQQSQLSQHDIASFADAFFASLFFIGHESPLQQQHDIATADENDVPVVEYATIPRAKTRTAAVTKNILVFISLFSIKLENIAITRAPCSGANLTRANL